MCFLCLPINFFSGETMTTALLARLLRKLGIRVGSAPTVVTASRTLREDDAFDVLYCDSATDITLTIRHDLPEGWEVKVVQAGVGKVVFAGQASETVPTWQDGVTAAVGNATTLHNVSGHTKTAGRYASATLTQMAANSYVLYGDTGV